VKVFLLPLDHAESFFYGEDEQDNATPAAAALQGGLQGWLARTSAAIGLWLQHPKGKPAQKLKHAWDWLQTRMHPDEPLLAALRSAGTLAVYHRSSLAAAEVQGQWISYLRRRLRRHLIWLVFDAVLAPLSLLLTPLPGPNLIGYWFAYRAVRHALIVRGIRRALTGRLETTFHPVVDLDSLGGCRDHAWRARAAERYELTGLHEFVARIAPEAGAAVPTLTDEMGQNQRPCGS
jgi:hypothetical protein